MLNGIVIPAFEIRRITDKNCEQKITGLGSLQKKFCGERIKELRQKNGMSQELAASLSGITMEEFVQIENGSFNQAQAPVIRIIEILGGSRNDMFL